ncbi:MAG: MarR family winged helix-turn-helix transcriptional regulator [Hyphomicrobiales bacterium]
MASKNPLKRPKALGRVLNFTAGASTLMCQELLEPYGLTLQQWVILSALWRRDGMLVTEIADYVGTNTPAASRIIDRMEERGFVDRKPSASDRRAVLVNITEKGQELSHLSTFFQDVNNKLLDGLSDDESTLLFELLARVEANAKSNLK